MVVQTTDRKLYNIFILDRISKLDKSVDLMQDCKVLHLNKTESAYMWGDDSESLIKKSQNLCDKGYIVHIEEVQ